MLFITRRETFNSAHRLFREDWSDEKNLEVFLSLVIPIDTLKGVFQYNLLNLLNLLSAPFVGTPYAIEE